MSGMVGSGGKPTAPAKIPAAPIPAIALPTMNVTELEAAPQMAEASPNMRTLRERTYLRGKKVQSLPNNSCSAQHVNKYALPYQPTSSKELKSSVI
jgi:hypothetical protein